MSQKDKHQFSVSGHTFSVSHEQVVEKLATIKAHDIEEVRKIYVVVNNRKFPVKQALHAVQPKLMRSGFTSSEALRVFRKLDFEVGDGG